MKVGMVLMALVIAEALVAVAFYRHDEQGTCMLVLLITLATVIGGLRSIMTRKPRSVS